MLIKNKIINLIVLAIIMLLSYSSLAYSKGCEYDTQCKGDRICKASKCVEPTISEPLPSEPEPDPNPIRSPPRFCCTNVGKLGPYPNSGRIAEGDACYGTTPNGYIAYGLACY